MFLSHHPEGTMNQQLEKEFGVHATQKFVQASMLEHGGFLSQ